VTTQPSSNPSTSASPSTSPSVSTQPTSSPSALPSASPFVLFIYGESFYTDDNLGIQISVGLTAKRIAQTGSRVNYADGGQSSISYHGMMDAAGIAPLPGGGYVYMSNSEKSSGTGGVYGLYFNKDGEITNYKALLTGTSRNCGGGISPWNTWISCEEVGGGQCWQVEPNPDSPNHNSPKATLLGGSSGGSYETVAVDNTNPDGPIFFTTEDTSNGELRRFKADGNGWDALHVGGQTTYLEFLSGNRFQWTSSLSAGETSAANYYPNAEGIVYHNSTLYFVAKVTRTLFILDLNDKTYTSERTGSSWVGQGSFNSQPDQIIESDLDIRKYIYFTEDGGDAPGVHVRDKDGKYYSMARGIPGGRYSGDETVGIAFSPDRKKFYFGFQDAGVLMEVTRDDGLPFD
jgi:secreted PhoX family phosphatase